MAEVFIGIGSSLNRSESVKVGIQSLKNMFGTLSISPLYESEAVGFKGENFYNLVVGFITTLQVKELLSQLKKIEIESGRLENAIKFTPRTLDLDLLLYDDYVEPQLNIPRAEITKNAFVLKPLAEIAPDRIHPVLNKTYQQLWTEYPKKSQKLWQITDHL